MKAAVAMKDVEVVGAVAAVTTTVAQNAQLGAGVMGAVQEAGVMGTGKLEVVVMGAGMKVGIMDTSKPLSGARTSRYFYYVNHIT